MVSFRFEKWFTSNHRKIEVRELDLLESLLGGPVFLDVFANDVFFKGIQG